MKNRPPATKQRADRYGLANQMSHEAKGRRQRDAMLESMAADKAAVRKRNKRSVEQGANAGTIGGSRGARINAFLGR